MDTLLEFFDYDLVGGNTVGTVFFFTVAIVATLGLAKLAQVMFQGKLREIAERTVTKIDDILLETFQKPIYWIVLLGGLGLSLQILSMPEVVASLVSNVVMLTMIMFVAWSATNLITALRETYLDPLIEESTSKLDDQIIPILESTIKVTIWAFAVLIAFDNVGFDIMSLLTGLGIGGIALAMAAKDTLANVFGSLTVFTDQPFHVGDTVTFAGHTGTITLIGLRTCRLKTFDGTIVMIPNAMLVGKPVENISSRTARKFTGTVGLVYETKPEALDAAIAAIKTILDADEKIRDDFAVRFANFGDSALEISVLYWVDPPGDYWDTVSEVNRAILQKFTENGWDMAFPSMTVYKGSE